MSISKNYKSGLLPKISWETKNTFNKDTHTEFSIKNLIQGKAHDVKFSQREGRMDSLCVIECLLADLVGVIEYLDENCPNHPF